MMTLAIVRSTSRRPGRASPGTSPSSSPGPYSGRSRRRPTAKQKEPTGLQKGLQKGLAGHKGFQKGFMVFQNEGSWGSKKGPEPNKQDPRGSKNTGFPGPPSLPRSRKRSPGVGSEVSWPSRCRSINNTLRKCRSRRRPRATQKGLRVFNKRDHRSPQRKNSKMELKFTPFSQKSF